MNSMPPAPNPTGGPLSSARKGPGTPMRMRHGRPWLRAASSRLQPACSPAPTTRPYHVTVHPISVLAERGARWSRTDLVWSLHWLAEELALDDGGVHWLPATIAATLDSRELAGLASALL